MSDQQLEEMQPGRQIPGSAPLPYLRGWRVKRGYGVRQFAKLAGVSPSSVIGWEEHNKRAYAPTIIKLAKALGVRWWILLDVSADDVGDRRRTA